MSSRDPARAGVVVGLFLGLLVAFALAAGLFRPGPRPCDASEVFAVVFDLPDELPFELELGDAVRLPSGDRIAVLATPAYAEGIPRTAPKEEGEDESAEEDAIAGEAAAEGAATAKADEERPEPPRDTPPVEAILTVYHGAGPVVAQFSNLEVKEQGEDEGGPKGPHWTIEFGRLEWDRYRASFVHERAGLGTSFRDSVRVNVSAGEHFAVLSVQWPVGHVGSKERVVELLRGLRFRE